MPPFLNSYEKIRKILYVSIWKRKFYVKGIENVDYIDNVEKWRRFDEGSGKGL
jgi:hypothetical protein